MSTKDDVQKEYSRRKWTAWFGMVFFGLCGVVGVFSKEYWLGALSALFVFAEAIILWNIRRSSRGQFKEYVPRRGFRYYRFSVHRKVQLLKYSQFVIGCITVLGAILFRPTMFRPIGYGIAGILVIQAIKMRIRVHTKIDDASLFELEARGILGPGEIVKAIYKDFQSWNEDLTGKRIVFVTQDALVSIKFTGTSNVTRSECRLADIQRIKIDGKGNYGTGLILIIGTKQNQLFRVILDGGSNQDSPEEFIGHFLEALDDALDSQASVQHSERIIDKSSESPVSVHMSPSIPEFSRQVDIPEPTINQESNSVRYIDL